MEKCKVKIENGYHFVYLPDGTQIPAICETKVVQTPEKSETYAVIKILVDLES